MSTCGGGDGEEVEASACGVQWRQACEAVGLEAVEFAGGGAEGLEAFNEVVDAVFVVDVDDRPAFAYEPQRDL